MLSKNLFYDLKILNNPFVHLWVISLREVSSWLEDFEDVLSAEERHRARCFMSERARTQFITCHGILRLLLGNYLNQDPREISILTERFGKPYLNNPGNPENIQFNISHSEEVALFAFTRGKRIGVDLEKIRELEDMRIIVKHFFSRRENVEFSQLLPEDQRLTFFSMWTRKEAFVKAMGSGITFPLHKVRVPLSSKVLSGLLSIEENYGLAFDAAFYHLEPAPGYAGALVVEGQNAQFELKPLGEFFRNQNHERQEVTNCT